MKRGTFMFIKNFARAIFWGAKSSSAAYVNYLRKQGVSIGDRTTFYEPTSNLVDIQRPYLIKIGDDVQITHGVVILTHGYDWSVLKHCYGDILGSAGRVEIGNNVFIGVNAMILKGVKIGNNVIIGAYSLVNKDIPDNCVYAGNPAKFVVTIEEYYEKRKAAQILEAKDMAIAYYERHHKIPSKDLFREFFWLFENSAQLPSIFDDVLSLTGNYELSRRKFFGDKRPFDGFEKFIDYCELTKNHDEKLQMMT